MSGDSWTAESPAGRTISTADLTDLAAEVLSRGGCFRFQATGTSMHPLIRSGDSVVICSPPDRLRRGSVVLTRRHDSGLVVLHRLIQCGNHFESHGFVTMGDNSRTPDPPVGRDEIIGVVSAVVRNARLLDLSGTVQQGGGSCLAWLGACRSRLLEAQGAGRWLRRCLTLGRLVLSRVLWLAQLTGRGRPK